MPLLTRRKIIAAKLEAVEGTAEAITVAEGGILALDPKFDADIKFTDRKVSINTLSNPIPVLGSQMAKLSFRVELKGAGAAYSASVKPALRPYLMACGFAETLVTTPGSESCTYKPASSGLQTVTIWLYVDGVIKKLKGARGNVKFSGKVGEPCYAEFDFQGVYDGVVDGAMISPTFESTVPPAWLNSAMTIDSYAAVCTTFNVDMGNNLQMREDASSSVGYRSCLLTERNPTGKFDPEMTTVAAYDWYGKLKAGTPVALNLPIGAVQYNKCVITAPKMVYKNVTEGDRSGNQVADLDFALAMNTGDDEISIAFN